MSRKTVCRPGQGSDRGIPPPSISRPVSATRVDEREQIRGRLAVTRRRGVQVSRPPAALYQKSVSNRRLEVVIRWRATVALTKERAWRQRTERGPTAPSQGGASAGRCGSDRWAIAGGLHQP